MEEAPRLSLLERRVQADPTSVAFAALAEEYRRLGRYQDAVDVSRKGLVRHPAYLSARVTLGRALFELNRLDEARQEFEFVLRTAPENLAAIRGLADIHHRGGQTSDSAEHYEAALAAAEHGLSSGSRPAVEPPPAALKAPSPVAATAAVRPVPAAPPVPPPPDPALTALERFLEAIVAARAAERSADSER